MEYYVWSFHTWCAWSITTHVLNKNFIEQNIWMQIILCNFQMFTTCSGVPYFLDLTYMYIPVLRISTLYGYDRDMCIYSSLPLSTFWTFQTFFIKGIALTSNKSPVLIFSIHFKGSYIIYTIILQFTST